MFQLLPESIAVLIPALSLVLIGHIVEEHYVGRITCFSNVMALNVHYLTIGETGLLLRIHANLGLLLGVYGLWAYIQRESLSSTYYNFVHLFYSSFVVGTILLYPQANWIFSFVLDDPSLPLTLLVGLVLLFNFILLDDADDLHYTGGVHPDVVSFIKKWEIRVPDGSGGYQMVPLREWFK